VFRPVPHLVRKVKRNSHCAAAADDDDDDDDDNNNGTHIKTQAHTHASTHASGRSRNKFDPNLQ